MPRCRGPPRVGRPPQRSTGLRSRPIIGEQTWHGRSFSEFRQTLVEHRRHVRFWNRHHAVNPQPIVASRRRPSRAGISGAPARYGRKATVGYQSVPRCGYTALDERRWTDACPARGGRSTGRSPCAPLPPDHQLPVKAVGPLGRSAGDLGTTLARTRHGGQGLRRPTRRGTGHRVVVRPDGTGGPGDRLRRRNLDPGDGRRRTPPRRGRRRGLPTRARTAAQRCRPGGPDQRAAHPR